MSSTPGYLIDSDVLITAKNRYYAFSICPGFWDSVLRGHSHGHIHSIDRVRDELLRGRADEDLVQWVRQSVPAGFFLSKGVKEVDAFEKVILWVNQNKQYKNCAKNKFASGADGWLVAHGMTTGKTVVTNEQPSPNSSSRIKLPDVCDAFNVDCEGTFAMLHTLGVRFIL